MLSINEDGQAICGRRHGRSTAVDMRVRKTRGAHCRKHRGSFVAGKPLPRNLLPITPSPPALASGARRGRTRPFKIGPVVSHAAATRPPQSLEHGIRCSTSATVWSRP
jgi:hypothetical protein